MRFIGTRPRALRAAVLLAAALAAPVWALSDIALYSDMSATAGCGNGVPQSSVQGTTLLSSVGGLVPIDCTQKHAGADAMRMQLGAGLGVGDWFNYTVKFAGMQQKNLTGYADLRFFACNTSASAARFSIRFENWLNNTASWSQRIQYTIPASSSWTEYVITLSSVSGFSPLGSNGVIFSEPEPKSGAAGGFTVYLDDMRFTDGSGQGSLTVPAAPGGSRPAGWPACALVGTYDKYEDGSSQLTGKFHYRYQYLNYLEWKAYGNGQFARTFVERSNALGMGSAFVWYYLGKAGEGDAVYQNLNNAAYMQTYFDDYELALSQMAAVQRSPIVIVLEPDAYGFLMLKGRIPGMDAAKMSVAMSRANQIAGGSYASTLAGFCQYMVARARTRLTGGVIIGHLLNHWGVYIPDELGHGTLDAHLEAGVEQAKFLNSLGAGKGDVFFVEKADRDAGSKGAGWFWDNAAYNRYFAWVKMISAQAGLRCVGWQISEGNMAHPNPANRDDAVAYFVNHTADWLAAGFCGVLFGPGMDGQADYRNDGGWFLSQMGAYVSGTCGPLSAQVRAPHTRVTGFRAPYGMRAYNVAGRAVSLLGAPRGVAVFVCGADTRLRAQTR